MHYRELFEQRPSSMFKKAARYLLDMIDWSGGDGETIYDMVRAEIDSALPTEYGAGSTTRRFHRALRYWALSSVEETFSSLQSMFRGNKINVWREITAPENWTIDRQHPGIYWSWDEHAAEAHHGHFNRENVTWLIHGIIDFENVDWPPTLAANTHPSYTDEKEIRLIEGKPVTILGVARR